MQTLENFHANKAKQKLPQPQATLGKQDSCNFLIYSQSNMDTTWQQMGFLEYFMQVSYDKTKQEAFANFCCKLLQPQIMRVSYQQNAQSSLFANPIHMNPTSQL